MINPVAEEVSVAEKDVPDRLKELVKDVRKLKTTPHDSERAHESLVEDLFAALGCDTHSDIEWRLAYIDLSLRDNKGLLAVVEVKRDWGLVEVLRRSMPPVTKLIDMLLSEEPVTFINPSPLAYFPLLIKRRGQGG